DFQRGDMVSVIGANRQLELGRGLTNYSSDEINKVKGLKTSEIRKVLGSKAYDEVVHRNNLVIDS
ncbi:MAG: PUA domain-containing protein, partial [Candidatus Anammoxibacter sp.]